MTMSVHTAPPRGITKKTAADFLATGDPAALDRYCWTAGNRWCMAVRARLASLVLAAP